MTTSWLMIAVVVVAILTAAGIMVRRSRDFARQAAFHATEEAQRKFVLEAFFVPSVEDALKEEQKYLKLARAFGSSTPDPFLMEQVASSRQKVEQGRARIDALARQRDYHAGLKQQYERAVTHPWEQVPVDPPEPSYPQFGPPMPEAIGDPLGSVIHPEAVAASDSVLCSSTTAVLHG
jgi:hypothetical protein